MSDIHATIRKFERFLSSHGSYYNNCTEVRPDTKGALPDEITNYPVRQSVIEKDKIIELGCFIDNPEKKTVKYFRYKSRGKK